MKKGNERIAMRVSAVSIAWNVALSVFKLLAGLIGHSGAMISDAVHSASDVFSTVIVIVGVKIAGRDSDKNHPYGHERLECVAALLLAVVLGLTGLMIGFTGLKNIIAGTSGHLEAPGALALVAAVVSIAVKESMYWYTRAAAKKIHSSALMADAWHHRSDALSSIGSFAGILGARMGFPVLDPIASLVICLFIVKAAVDVFRDAVSRMTDTSCGDDTVEEVRRAASDTEGVLGVDLVRTRLFGDRIYVDIEIEADGNLSLFDAHAVAERVHDEVEQAVPACKHCMVHVNPAPPLADGDGAEDDGLQASAAPEYERRAARNSHPDMASLSDGEGAGETSSPKAPDDPVT